MTAALERLGKSSSFRAARTAAGAAGAGFTLQQQQGHNEASHHSGSLQAQSVGCADGYMGAPAVAPKIGKSSSSPGLVLLIVFTVKEGSKH